MTSPSAANPDARVPLPAVATSSFGVGASRPMAVNTVTSGTPTWLGPFFWFARTCPTAASLLKPMASALVPMVSPRVREAIRKNTPWLFGRKLSSTQQRLFARQVVGSFYDFVLDVGRASQMTPQQLVNLVERVEGLEGYRAARAQRRGAILVTAHLGTYEVGLAALAHEEKKVRVVFKRDPSPGFEQMRAGLHRTLGVIESPIDDGIETWLSLREALLNDEVVVMQADRAVKGQKSEVVPFLHGHLRMPTGPVRLAQLTGSPIIPVFALPSGTGGYHVLLKPAIEPHAPAALDRDSGPSAVLRALADAMAQVVAAYPHLWLALEAVFHEDEVA